MSNSSTCMFLIPNFIQFCKKDKMSNSSTCMFLILNFIQFCKKYKMSNSSTFMFLIPNFIQFCKKCKMSNSSTCMFLILNCIQFCKKYKMCRQNTFTPFKWSETATDIIYTKLALTGRNFINSLYTEFIDKLTSNSVSATKSQTHGRMDGRDLHIRCSISLGIEGNILIYMGWKARITIMDIRFSTKGRISHMKCSPMELTCSTVFMLHVHDCHNIRLIQGVQFKSGPILI